MSTVSEEIIEINIKKKKPRAKKTEFVVEENLKLKKFLKKEDVNLNQKIQLKLTRNLKKEVANPKKHSI